jgi:hypothetical protein
MGGALSSMATAGGPVTRYPTLGSPSAVAVDTTSIYYLSRQGDLVKITPK